MESTTHGHPLGSPRPDQPAAHGPKQGNAEGMLGNEVLEYPLTECVLDLLGRPGIVFEPIGW